MVSDHHKPYVKAGKTVLPGATHIRTGLHRRRGETTKSIERSHIAIRDRLRCSRGLKSVTAGKRFLEDFEAMQALSRSDVLLSQLITGYRPTLATHQQRVRAVVAAIHVLGVCLRKLPKPKGGSSAAALGNAVTRLRARHPITSQTPLLPPGQVVARARVAKEPGFITSAALYAPWRYWTSGR